MKWQNTRPKKPKSQQSQGRLEATKPGLHAVFFAFDSKVVLAKLNPMFEEPRMPFLASGKWKAGNVEQNLKLTWINQVTFPTRASKPGRCLAFLAALDSWGSSRCLGEDNSRNSYTWLSRNLTRHAPRNLWLIALSTSMHILHLAQPV